MVVVGTWRWLVAIGVVAALVVSIDVAAQDAARGAYLLRAGGCVACHTDLKGGGPELAGGRALGTPFGTFYSPNITPDPETGTGAWSEGDFARALRMGVSPAGEHYFPVFPYPSYTRMSDGDVRDLWAYLRSLPPVRRENLRHDVSAPFSWRFLQAGWKMLFFEEGAFRSDPDRTPAWNRGAYLVNALAHCGECHTPRNRLGGPDHDLFLAGTADGPEGERVPNITPDPATGIGGWTTGDIVQLLKSSLKPDYDNVQGTMAEAVEHGLRHLSDEDLEAIAEYLREVPPVVNKVPSGKS
jgi:mono/diheme cytochrome c family protein